MLPRAPPLCRRFRGLELSPSPKQEAQKLGMLSRSRCMSSPTTGKGINPNQNYEIFKLMDTFTVAKDSKVLRFALPAVGSTSADTKLGLPAPNGVKVKAYTDTEGWVSKSYSPISHPDADGFYDLLVKEYNAPGEGGMSRYLCGLQPGDEAEIWVKPAKKRNYAWNTWDHVGLVAGGTGIAPFIQIIRYALANDADRTRLLLVYANRTEDSIMLRDEIDDLCEAHPDRFSVYYTLSQPPSDWVHGQGRVSAEMVAEHLPGPSPSTQVFVCGTDGFLETVCGPKVRLEGQHKKEQGPTTGLLGDIGFSPENVFKL